MSPLAGETNRPVAVRTGAHRKGSLASGKDVWDNRVAPNKRYTLLIDEAELAALETLFLPFKTAVLPLGTSCCFLRARHGAVLGGTNHDQPFVCQQSFKPDADALLRGGFHVVCELTELSRRFATVLVLPPRQREESRALLANAVQLAEPGGRVVIAASNNAGARSHESDLAKLAGTVTSLSKNKCRVSWTNALEPTNLHQEIVNEWKLLDAPRAILDGRFVSRPGVFAWDRVDAASELLAASLPQTLAGAAADLGAGFGYLSAELLRRCEAITKLDVYEAEHRALMLAETNLRNATRVTLDFIWHDVTQGLTRRYDVIVSNPPFHTSSGRDDPGLGRRFIAAAAAALNPGGRLWMVANRHLPYEAILNASFGSVRNVSERYGFKIIEAIRAKGANR